MSADPGRGRRSKATEATVGNGCSSKFGAFAAEVNPLPQNIEAMMDYEVTRIRRDGADLDRRIDMLAGPLFGPAHIDTVIMDILVGSNSYYVTAGLWSAFLEVKEHPVSRRQYLRTIPDGLYDNNLYALPEI